MNCSAIGMVRTATQTNGRAALNGAILQTPAATKTATAAINGTSTKHVINNNSHNMHIIMNNQLNGTQQQQQSLSYTIKTNSTKNGENKGKNIDLAAKIIQQSNIICFDVDSTVIKEEGIDELADFCGKGSEVARVTKEAMGGAMTFQDALKIRLNIIRPTQRQINDFIKMRPATLTRNVKRFIEQLKANGKQVYLISGGFDCLIEPVANELGIPMSNLFANKLMFYHNGDYATFDTTQPTSKSGGKAEAISIIKQQNPEGALVTMIGDGVTDLEAIPPANYFIGFGGNVVRAEVFKRAQYYVNDFEQLI